MLSSVLSATVLAGGADYYYWAVVSLMRLTVGASAMLFRLVIESPSSA